MAELTAKSLDDELTDLVATYDSLIAPKRIWRNNNNKLYLVFRSIAAGLNKIRETVLALKYRFNPLYCDESDLLSTMKIVGTELKRGASSLLDIIVTNEDDTLIATIKAGTYEYVSADGEIFSFTLAVDQELPPLASLQRTASSQSRGAFPVTQNEHIAVTRADGAIIDSSLSFFCLDNAGRLGYADESLFDVRQRILADTERQDHINELELAIRNLPNILECTLVLNPSNSSVTYDDVTLAPMELLITLNGAPTEELAKTVVQQVIYSTYPHEASPKVVYYYNDILIDGKLPVYYREYAMVDFSVNVAYLYDDKYTAIADIEKAIRKVLSRYQQKNSYIPIVTEKTIYDLLTSTGLSGVTFLSVDITDSTSTQVDFIKIPRTRLPNLTTITTSPVRVEDF